ncbi:MAG: class I SAM-dependent methyltransferase, partial [Nanoarchaeota archaeon]|nr:class I SAM-dependent methyltransferase [Nanoarchaeota archaeon]
MKVNRKLKTTFGNVSRIYEKSRVTYPEKLIEDIISFAKESKDAKILDVGCGSGQATSAFSKRGFSVLGVDVSRKLIDIAKKKCPKAKFI